eukprot:scaffold37058_cov26-Prasinocladus_malaysianus.AAC.1
MVAKSVVDSRNTLETSRSGSPPCGFAYGQICESVRGFIVATSSCKSRATLRREDRRTNELCDDARSA